MEEEVEGEEEQRGEMMRNVQAQGHVHTFGAGHAAPARDKALGAHGWQALAEVEGLHSCTHLDLPG